MYNSFEVEEEKRHERIFKDNNSNHGGRRQPATPACENGFELT